MTNISRTADLLTEGGDERARIAEAAALTDSPFLQDAARHGSQEVDPERWARAVERADREIRMYGGGNADRSHPRA